MISQQPTHFIMWGPFFHICGIQKIACSISKIWPHPKAGYQQRVYAWCIQYVEDVFVWRSSIIRTHAQHLRLVNQRAVWLPSPFRADQEKEVASMSLPLGPMLRTSPTASELRHATKLGPGHMNPPMFAKESLNWSKLLLAMMFSKLLVEFDWSETDFLLRVVGMMLQMLFLIL